MFQEQWTTFKWWTTFTSKVLIVTKLQIWQWLKEAWSLNHQGWYPVSETFPYYGSKYFFVFYECNYYLDHNFVNEVNKSIGTFNVWPHDSCNNPIIIYKCRHFWNILMMKVWICAFVHELCVYYDDRASGEFICLDWIPPFSSFVKTLRDGPRSTSKSFPSLELANICFSDIFAPTFKCLSKMWCVW